MIPRRTFISTLLGSAALASLAAPALRGGDGLEKAPSDVALLNVALELEHTAIFAYGLAGGSGLLSKEVLEVGGLFKGSHEGHRDALSKVVKGLGGFPIAPKSSYDFGAFELKTEKDLLRLALFLEMKAAHTYQQSLARFRKKSLLGAAGSILGDEVSHAALLRSALGKGPVAFYRQLDEGLD
jgi:hypothetical protein